MAKKKGRRKKSHSIANAGKPIGSTFSPTELQAVADAVKAKFDLALEWIPERSALGRAFGKLRQGTCGRQRISSLGVS
jgi:hypothetical protein